ncbi:CHAT domain-containing protein [Dactylosporangium sp. NPDC049525]|uniref:CHAT domain-containing protein n=1 Tax=Dactylosporangium sp. NPDC049525 TaxID=3154730 RepID=UPI0034173EEA
MHDVRRWLELAGAGDGAGDPDVVLDPAALVAVRALAATAPSDDLDTALVIAVAYWLRYLQLPEGEDEADLAEAVHWFGRVFPHAPDQVPRSLHAGLAVELPPAGDDPDSWSAEAARYLTGGAVRTPEVLDRVIRLLEAAAGAGADPQRAIYLINLCSAQQSRFAMTGAVEALDAAVRAGTVAVSIADVAVRAAAAGNLGNAFRARYEARGSDDDLTAAVEYGRKAITLGAPDDPRMAAYRSSLGTALQTRYDRHGDAADLDASIVLGADAVELTPRDDPARCGRLSNLGNALRLRYLRTGSVDDLERSIRVGTEAVSSDPAAADLAIYRSNLASALRDRFDATGDQRDLDAAIEHVRAAAEAVGPGHPRRPGYLSNLASMLRNRAETTGSQPDLDAAVDAADAAAAAVGDLDPDRPVILSALALALDARFGARGAIQDLHRAVDVMERAVAGSPPGSTDRPRCLSGLSNLLRRRFERTGAADDLDRAVTHAGEAVRETPPQHVYRAAYLAHLANALHGRFEYAGATGDLDQAITFAREATRAGRGLPEADPDRGRYLTNLCGFLNDRYTRHGQVTDVEEAVVAGRAAVAAVPAAHPERGTTLSNLSNAMISWFGETGDVDDLGRAVELAIGALVAVDTAHPERARFASNLAAVLLMRSEHDPQPGSLALASAAAQEAVAATDAASLYRAGRIGNLAEILSLQYTQDGQPATLDRALAAFAEGAAAQSAPIVRRARLARSLARLAGRAGRWETADRAWADVGLLLPALVDHTLVRADRQRHLELLNGFGPEAAAVRTHLGDLEGAWAALEAGRGVLLSQALQTRADVDELEARHPDLFEQFEQLRLVLNDPAGDGHGVLTPAAADRQAAARRAAAQAWTALLERIRQLPGLTRFGLPPTTAQMRDAAGDGVIVAINITEIGSAALTLTRDRIDVVHLDVTAAEALANINGFLAAAADPDGFAANDRRGAVLAWLWDAICEPVLRRLGHLGPPPSGDAWPRVWWMPTGPLALLPIHAAGRQPADAGDAAAVPERVVSSYTPTVRTLLHQRRRRSPGDGGVSAVVVGVQTAAGLPPLPRAGAEAREVARRFGVAPLLDAAATSSAVRAGLVGATHAHFACHAVTGADDPSDGRLELHAESLMIRDLAALTVPRGHLAYLSACGTAFGGMVLLDESVHIASGLQLAGFAHVIGTLWRVADADAAEITAMFYEELAAGAGPAQAMHHVTRGMRRRYRRNPGMWAAYAHFGP